MSPPEWSLFAQDFRGLRSVRWSPRGVSLLCGPNGAGKTSILDLLEFLCRAVDRGIPEAVRLAGGGALLRRLGAEPKAPVRLGLSVGTLRWEIDLPVEGGSIHPLHGEIVEHGDRVLARRTMYADEVELGRLQKDVTEWGNPTPQAVTVKILLGPGEPGDAHESYVVPGHGTALIPSKYDPAVPSLAPQLARQPTRSGGDARSMPQRLLDVRRPIELPEELTKLVDLVGGIRIHRAYWLDEIREPQAALDVDATLLESGKNVWNVLRNWRSAPRKFRDQFHWVVTALRKAFPELLVDLEFETVGQTVVGRFYLPNGSDSLPLHLAPDGLLVGILHLTAVAGAPEGAIVAFDGVENELHPHAIRAILGAMRERAEERGLTIVLTTHSPIVMNEFKGHEDRLYVLEKGHETLPVPLVKALDPDWIAHFSLGDLYDREEFAPQQAAREPSDRVGVAD